MPSNKKPRKRYRPRGVSIYPDLHDVGLIFRPIHRIFESLRNDEIETIRGIPIFQDWQGDYCAVVPALEGWALCWERISKGEGIVLHTSAIRAVAKRLDKMVPMLTEHVDAAFTEMLATQSAVLRIPRDRLAKYMRAEQIQIEVDRLGLSNASA